MNCFKCARRGEASPAVGICRHCGVALCIKHLAEAKAETRGGAHTGCSHAIPVAAATR